MEEILPHLQTAWSLFSAATLAEQIGLSTLAAAGVYGAAVGAARTVLRGWRLAGGVAGGVAWAWGWLTTALPVRDDVAGLVELMRDPSAWEFHGTTGVRHVLNGKVVVAEFLTALGDGNVVLDLNRRERNALRAARVELRGKLDREFAAASLAKRLKV